MYYLATIGYEAGNFWVAIAALVVAVASLVAAIVSLLLAKTAVRIARDVADRDLRNWWHQKWFDLYEAAENFCTLLERFQTKYDRLLDTREFVDDANDLTFAIRRVLPFASVFPVNPTVNAFFACVRKWKLDENLLSKEMLKDYGNAVEGLRQEARVPVSNLKKD